MKVYMHAPFYIHTHTQICLHANTHTHKQHVRMHIQTKTHTGKHKLTHTLMYTKIDFSLSLQNDVRQLQTFSLLSLSVSVAKAKTHLHYLALVYLFTHSLFCSLAVHQSLKHTQTHKYTHHISLSCTHTRTHASTEPKKSTISV